MSGCFNQIPFNVLAPMSRAHPMRNTLWLIECASSWIPHCSRADIHPAVACCWRRTWIGNRLSRRRPSNFAGRNGSGTAGTQPCWGI